jgi:hypothetical protein
MSERLRRLCSISVSKAKTRKLDPQRSGGDMLDPALSHTRMYPYMEAVYRVVTTGSLVAAVNSAMPEVANPS